MPPAGINRGKFTTPSQIDLTAGFRYVIPLMNETIQRDPITGRIAAGFDAVFGWIAFASICLSVLVGPWFFGAWESWWFWPFVVVISAGVVATGLRLVVPNAHDRPAVPKRVCGLLLSVIPFLAYALFRAGSAEVFMDAQRSVLLHVTALGVVLVIVFGLNPRQRLLLFGLIFLNLLLLGIYGVVNHLVWGSEHVLWMPRYEQYAGRATGSYFCPDHFAGVMELLLCMAVGLLADRGCPGRWKLVAGMGGLVAVIGVLLSQSRGGGMTLVVIFAMAMVWGVAQWPHAVRWYLRLIGISASLLLLMGLFLFGSDYVDRFSSYGGGWGTHAGSDSGPVEQVVDALSRTSRGRMYAGAVRAWKTAPWFGIGPGMHQHLWPHFAPSSDGDRELGVWPTLSNHDFRSYEVHNDWLQLLEEYGGVGMLLFGIPFFWVWRLYGVSASSEKAVWEVGGEHAEGPFSFAVMLGGGLSFVAMSFHSLGDFNLQMPATVWLFAAILTLSLVGECAAPNRKKGTR